jgi:hypothetical protein
LRYWFTAEPDCGNSEAGQEEACDRAPTHHGANTLANGGPHQRRALRVLKHKTINPDRESSTKKLSGFAGIS